MAVKIPEKQFIPEGSYFASFLNRKRKSLTKPIRIELTSSLGMKASSYGRVYEFSTLKRSEYLKRFEQAVAEEELTFNGQMYSGIREAPLTYGWKDSFLAQNADGQDVFFYYPISGNVNEPSARQEFEMAKELLQRLDRLVDAEDSSLILCSTLLKGERFSDVIQEAEYQQYHDLKQLFLDATAEFSNNGIQCEAWSFHPNALMVNMDTNDARFLLDPSCKLVKVIKNKYSMRLFESQWWNKLATALSNTVTSAQTIPIFVGDQTFTLVKQSGVFDNTWNHYRSFRAMDHLGRLVEIKRFTYNPSELKIDLNDATKDVFSPLFDRHVATLQAMERLVTVDPQSWTTVELVPVGVPLQVFVEKNKKHAGKAFKMVRKGLLEMHRRQVMVGYMWHCFIDSRKGIAYFDSDRSMYLPELGLSEDQIDAKLRQQLAQFDKMVKEDPQMTQLKVRGYFP